MRYEILLDDTRIEDFEGSEMEATLRFEDLKKEFLNEEVYDEIELVELHTIKKESLICEAEEKNG